MGGGAPLAGSTVTLWAASTDSPKSLAQATTAADGTFTLAVPDGADAGSNLYLIVKGGRSAAINIIPSATGAAVWSLLEVNASGNLADVARDRMVEQARQRIAALFRQAKQIRGGGSADAAVAGAW